MNSISRRGLQISLGVLWLLDGLLQLQHQMFTTAFANQVIAPAAAGQPAIVSSPLHFAVRVVLSHPAVWNGLFAGVQLSLGAGLLWRPTVRPALYASVVWALLVWYLGEGLGGLLSGRTSLLMGAPGAALLYAVLALAALPGRNNSKAATRPACWVGWIWVGLWLGGAVLQLLPGQNSVSAVGAMIAGNADGAPDWLAALDLRVAHFLYQLGVPAGQFSAMHMSGTQMGAMPGQTGFWFILLLAGVQAAIGLAVLRPGAWRRAAVAGGIILTLAFWIVGQSLGEYYSGLATDPSTGPLVILLGVAVLAAGFGASQLFARLERWLT